MIGKLSYEQVEQILMNISTSSNNLRSFLESFSGDDQISLRAKKALGFCNEVDKYVSNLSDVIELNKDVDKIIDRLKEKQA